MSEINVKFPDGAVKQFAAGTTTQDIAKSISISLAKKSVAGEFNGKLVDYNEPLNEDGEIKIITKDSDEGMNVLWQTAANVLASALHSLYPEMKFGQGEALEHGFFFDTDNAAGQVAEADFEKIEQKMQEIIKQNLPIERVEYTEEEALQLVDGDQYQTELVKEIAADNAGKVVAHKLGDFNDFSFGPQLASTGAIKVFQLLSVAGAYWKGASSNPMLQRIYGTAFYKQKDLDAELQRRKEARERDHRVIGNNLDLFFVDPKVGAGLPYWMPNGATIRRTIERYIIDKEVARGYEHVYTPILANVDLYKQSGHWDHYREDMFPPMDMGDGELLELRPMNCPSHIQVYNHHIRSYRDLPLRIAELGMMHRYEKSGALTGLSRVREMTLNDGHTFVAPDQIEEEFKGCVDLAKYCLSTLGLAEDVTYRLSLWDPNNQEKYLGDEKTWNQVQDMMREILGHIGIPYTEEEGEAAFYGPKLDIQAKNVYGKEDTMITIQLDMFLAERFDMTFINQDGEKERPYIIHRTSMGCYERTLAWLIEKYAGKFPTWLCPEQVRVLPISDKYEAYAAAVEKELKANGMLCTTDNRSEKIGYKIRESRLEKVPYMLVVGQQEEADGTVSVRSRFAGDEGVKPLGDFISQICREIRTKEIRKEEMAEEQKK